jgi:anoctamin-10
VQKIFVLNFITSYLGIILTAFVYVPFGQVLVPYLDIFKATAQKFTAEGTALPTKNWEINPDRLTKQIIYFTVTAQVVNFATEVIVPKVKRKVTKTVEQVAEKNGNGPAIKDVPEEHSFLKRVRDEAELDQYDVTVDYREMIIQFGTLTPFPIPIVR